MHSVWIVTEAGCSVNQQTRGLPDWQIGIRGALLNMYREEGRVEWGDCGPGGRLRDWLAGGAAAGWRGCRRRAGRHLGGCGHRRGTPCRLGARPPPLYPLVHLILQYYSINA